MIAFTLSPIAILPFTFSIMILMTALTEISYAQPNPPVAITKAHKKTIHGEARIDNYFWLREKKNPEVIEYLKAENAYAEEMSKPFAALGETLFQETLARWKQSDESVPYPMGDYLYYTRSEEGKQYVAYLRKSKKGGAEELLLDLNELGKGKPFIGLGVFKVSDDGKYLAYSVDTTGFREYQTYVKDLTTGTVIDDRIGRISSLEWSANSKYLFFTRENETKRPNKLYRYRIGTGIPEEVFEERSPQFNLYLSRTLDGELILAGSFSSTTSEYRMLPAREPLKPFALIQSRIDGHEYYVAHRSKTLYIWSNDKAKNFRLMKAPITHPSIEHWRQFIGEKPDAKLEKVLLFKTHTLMAYRKNGLIEFHVLDMIGGVDEISFQDEVYSASEEINREFDSPGFRYSYQSFNRPPSVYQYRFTDRTSILLKQTEVLGGHDPDAYVSKRIWIEARDGAKVPVSLVHKKEVKYDGSAPMLLYGYGSYGISIPVTFSHLRIGLLDRGVIFAIAHIRGGGELGDAWRDDGKLLKKKNTFTDFIDCAEYFVKHSYTSKERLAIEGRSAGGLLMGVVVNERPDLFAAVHLGVPFVDVVNSMLDETLPLTTQEYLEWGNPNRKDFYEYMRSYCPYSNLKAGDYPAMLLTTSLNDSQVMYWEPVKYTAKLRTLKRNNTPLLLRTNLAAGHGGASGRYDLIREQAYQMAFHLYHIGVKQ